MPFTVSLFKSIFPCSFLWENMSFPAKKQTKKWHFSDISNQFWDHFHHLCLTAHCISYKGAFSSHTKTVICLTIMKLQKGVVVNVNLGLTTGLLGQHKLLMSVISASLLLQQEENATVTSGGQEDGATTREQYGVSAQTASMLQVNSRWVFWPP